MLLSIQFPFADSRKFLDGTGRLFSPGWPLPSPDAEFVRSFGIIRMRKRGGLAGWVGENEICEANRALRFCYSPTLIDRESANRVDLRCVFRRFYCDGWAVGKFEVGVGTKKRTGLSLTKKQTENLVHHFLGLPVVVRNPLGMPQSDKLVRVNKHLSALYTIASTSAAQHTKIKPEAWWVRPGMPLIFLECDARDNIQIPYWSKPVAVPEAYGLLLSHCLVSFEGAHYRMWVLALGQSADMNKARALRLYLLRLHAEHECLRLVLRNVMAGNITITPRSKASQNLQSYFDKAIERIGELESKCEQKFDIEVAQIARESINLINPGQREKLVDTLNSLDLRKHLLRNLEEYAKRWGNVTIIENVEEQYMGDVFRDIHQSIIATRGSIAKGAITLQQQGAEEAAKAISELDRLIAKSPDEVMPQDKKAESADLLKGITDEATKPQPNKSILRAFGNSLLSIITSVEPLAKAGLAAFELIKPLWS